VKCCAVSPILFDKKVNRILEKLMKKSPILLFPTHYLGNFVLCLPWIRDIVDQYPDTVLVIDPTFKALLNMASIKPKTVIFYPRSMLSKNQTPRVKLTYFLKFIRQLRRYKNLDLIDLEGERFTGVLSLLSGSNNKIGPKQKHANWFYTRSHGLNYTQHRFDSYGEIINKWKAIKTPLSEVEYTMPEWTTNHAQGLDQGLDQSSKLQLPLVTVHVGASTYTKRWPVSYFVELATSLYNNGYRVAWIGADQEDLNIARLIEAESLKISSVNLCGKLSYVELVSLLKTTSLFVGADSGPMHIAASTGIPVIGLFGVTNDTIWAPLGNKSEVLRGTLGCKLSCRNKLCVADNRCMVSLNPKRVVESALSKLVGITSQQKVTV
jgi:heptosyltransferase-3